MVCRLVIAPDIQLALVLAVVGADDDERLGQHALRASASSRSADVRVRIPDARVIAVDPFATASIESICSGMRGYLRSHSASHGSVGS